MKYIRNFKIGNIDYLAGFTDGEGHIGLRIKKRPNTKLRLTWTATMTIANSNKDALDSLHEEWGIGRVNISKTIEFLRKRGENVKPAYLWILEPNDMRLILPTILPYLRIKNRQAELLIEALSLLKHGKGKSINDEKRLEEIYFECKKLNKRGIK